MGNLLLRLGLLIVGSMIGYDTGKKQGEEMYTEMVAAVLNRHMDKANEKLARENNSEYCTGYGQAVADITYSLLPVKEGRKENE